MTEQVEALLVEAESTLREKKFDEAKAQYLDILAIEPKSASALYALGTIESYSRDFQKAIEYLVEAVQIEPEAVDIAYNLAHCFAQVGERRGALVELQRATKYCHDDPVFCPLIAEILTQLGEPAAAISLLSRLNKLLPSDQIILAHAQGRLNQWHDAVSTLRRLFDATSDDKEVAEQLSIAAAHFRDYPTAISAFERYLQLITPKADDYLRFADLLLTAQDSTRCAQALDQAQKLGEASATLFVMRARLAQLNADYNLARESINQALERTPNHGLAWSIRATLASGDELDAYIDELETVLELKGDLASMNLSHQALLRYAHGDMSHRSEQFEQAAHSYDLANSVQYSAISEKNSAYNTEHTEMSVEAMMQHFHLDLMEAAEIGIAKQASSASPIFIVGMPRSGTTLVERILGQNEQIFSAGEQEAMEYVSVELRQQIAAGKIKSTDAVTTDQWLGLRQAYLDKMPKMNAPIFTDKLPHNFRNVGLIMKLFPEARIIQMHRGYQDVALSIYTHAFTAGHNYANRWEDISHFYQQSEKMMAYWSSLNSPRVMDLNYENLVQNPEYYAKKMVEFCGLEWNDAYLDFHKTVNESFTFSEMQVREPIQSKRVGRWRNYQSYFPSLDQTKS